MQVLYSLPSFLQQSLEFCIPPSARMEYYFFSLCPLPSPPSLLPGHLAYFPSKYTASWLLAQVCLVCLGFYSTLYYFSLFFVLGITLYSTLGYICTLRSHLFLTALQKPTFRCIHLECLKCQNKRGTQFSRGSKIPPPPPKKTPYGRDVLSLPLAI